MTNRRFSTGCVVVIPLLTIGTALFLSGLACSSAVTPSDTDPTQATEDDGLITEALGYEGTVSGKATDSKTTRESFDATEAGQTVPPEFDTEDTVVRFQDLDGNDLVDENGQPIDPVSVDSDGSFTGDGLPVGTDFVICVDIGSDGTCDLELIVHIPAQEGSNEGILTDIQVDPLTKLVLEKLRQLLEERGINPEDLPISPAAVVARIVEAYANLFEESGIEHTVTLEDIENMDADQLAALFDEILPAAVQTGMQIVDGNLKAALAEDAADLTLAVAEVFVRAGFPIVDTPGDPDLSSLAELDGIVAVTMEELFGPGEPYEGEEGIPEDLLDEFTDLFPDGVPDEIPDELLDQIPEELPDDIAGFLDELAEQFPEDVIADLQDDGTITVAQADEMLDFPEDELVYVSTVTEPDRNFANAEGEEEGMEGPGAPILNDFILMEMATFHLEHRRISLEDLHELLTSFDLGLGARLTYYIHDPNFFGPPLNVFETEDGKGKAINLEEIMFEFFEKGFHQLDEESFHQHEQELRGLLHDLLGDTVPPTYDKLFNGFVSERIEGIEQFTRAIRDARAHLPFNRSGASTFYVVADGDPYRMGPETNEVPVVSEITVNADVSVEGDIRSVTYDPNHNGKFFLGFTGSTEQDGSVELLVRETGRFLHGRHGPVRASIYDETVFQSINGMPFAEFVSETGVFYPGVSVSVMRDDFMMDSPEGEDVGMHEQLFVLATGYGEGAEPVRVDYDGVTGMATYNAGGRHLLMFVPESEQTGLFALFNEDTGRPASLYDPEDFFMGPEEQPEGFDDFFNETDDFGDVGNFENLDEFVDDYFQPDGEYVPPPPDGDVPPPDGEEPPPDGDVPPPDGEEPPPDGEEPPPDGDQPPDEPIDPAQVPEGGEPVEEPPIEGDEPIIDGQEPMGDPGFILIAAEDVIGLVLQREEFTHVFGVEVPNPRYNVDDDPYYDDLNGNKEYDAGEPTAPFRPTLFDPNDWRSTDIRLYYRRVDNGQSITFEEVMWDSETPMTMDGVELLPRDYKPRPNAFRFGRPNTAVNMLTAFAPPELFDGTHGLDRTTRLDVFMAVAIVNLVMDQVFNVEANIDIDGLGPLPAEHLLIDAHMFVAPVGDPFQMLLEGFRERSVVIDGSETVEPAD